jgi:hypothetical protein
MEIINDLLLLTNKTRQKSLQIREDPKTGIFVEGLTQRVLNFGPKIVNSIICLESDFYGRIIKINPKWCEE